MKLIDSHAHLDFEQFHGDFEDVLHRARKAGVFRVINIGVDAETSLKSITLAENNEGVFTSIGVHPDEGINVELEVLHEKLIELAKTSKKVVAIGECGLDYYHIKESVSSQKSHLRSRELKECDDEKNITDNQKDLFRLQIEVAEHLSLPLIIHIRNGEDDSAAIDTYEILKDAGCSKGVIHCFSLDAAWAKRFLELGYYLGFTGVITYKNAESIREAVKAAPIEKILIETDSPFLAPQGNRGKRNEPAFVVEVAEKIAELKGLSLEEIAAATTKNAENLFGI